MEFVFNAEDARKLARQHAAGLPCGAAGAETLYKLLRELGSGLNYSLLPAREKAGLLEFLAPGQVKVPRQGVA
jgi:hypothetical protein